MGNRPTRHREGGTLRKNLVPCSLFRPNLAQLRAQLAMHEMPAWPYAGAIALVEPTATTADWHVFWQWRHLGSVHDAAAAGALAQASAQFTHDDTPPTRTLCPRLDPAVYRLLRQRVAPDAGQAIVLL